MCTSSNKPHYIWGDHTIYIFNYHINVLQFISDIYFQPLTMAAVSALLLLLPVVWTCAPQKAGEYFSLKESGIAIPMTLWDRFYQHPLRSSFLCACCLSDYVMVSCFPNAIIANVPECPYGWEIGQLSLGGLCYSGVNSPGYFRFTIPDLTPKNNSYCGTHAEVRKYF